MAILLSTKPEWVAKICHEVGRTKDNIPIYEKRIEVRKGKPDKLPCKVYIYCNKSDKNIVNKDWSGKVIGEFVCDKILEIEVFKNGTIKNFWFYNLDKSCLSFDEMGAYIGKGNIGYGWHISELKIYDKPKELREFKTGCNGCKERDTYHCKFHCYGERPLTRPPQSYMYVRELCE